MNARHHFEPVPGEASPPSYRRVKDHVLRHILAGDWTVGERIPSENDLKGQLGVSRMTVHRALRELTEEGYVSRTVGAGTFVADRRTAESSIPVRDISEEARESGRRVRARVVARSRARAGPESAARLGLSRGDEIICLALVRWIGNTPIQLEERWVNAALAPDFMDQDFELDGVDESLLRSAPNARMTHEVTAVMLKGRDRTLLALGVNERCLRLTSTMTIENTVISVADLYMPSSRYALPGRFL
jgi:GntR family histidine utilization transcriptional repressor